MSFSIGPIAISFLEAHSWTARRQTEIVNVPFGQQTGFSTGAELVSYQLTGAFHADTDAEAKVLRRQLNELFANHDMNFEYIEFDGEDDEELSGWFLLDQVNTSIIPGVFGDYPFTASVRRLGNVVGHLNGTHWRSSPYTNDYALTGREWVAAPNSLGAATFNDDRPGDGGENKLIVAPAPLVNPIIYRDQPTFPDYFDMACRVYVTTIGFTSPNSVLNALNGTADKTEIFNVDHVPISDGPVSSRDAVFMTNGLIAWESGGKIYVYVPGDSPPWSRVVDSFVLETSTTEQHTSRHGGPIFEKINRDEIIFRRVKSTSDGSDQDAIIVRYKMKRGTYFIDTHVVTKGLDVGPTSFLFSNILLGGLTDASSAANFSVANNSKASIGYLHTETASSIITTPALTHFELGYTVAVNSETRFGIVTVPLTPPTGTTLTNLGDEFIANVTQEQVLINSRWV